MVLQRALGNIIENAIKYSPPATVISIHVSQSEKLVEISVQDNGQPIPEGYRQKVFERFFRVDASRSREAGGTGLGLAIASGQQRSTAAASGSRRLPAGATAF